MMNDFSQPVKEYFSRLKDTVSKLDIQAINTAMNEILQAYQREATIYIMGNGGSFATASHFVCDFNKGVSEKLSKKFHFVCLGDNVPIITAIANDISYDDIFLFQLEGVLKPSDLIIAISGSGNSKNVVKAAEYAKNVGCKVVSMTGYNGGKLKQLSDFSMHVNMNDMQIVEDIHMSFDHMMMRVLKDHLEQAKY
jgi:D-sedoheptulose 7-phosphate isomerase